MVTHTHLTYSEMRNIINSCKEIEDGLERKFSFDMYLISFTTDIEVPEDIDSGMWDKYTEDGVVKDIYEKVDNIQELEYLLNQELGIEATIRKAQKSLDEFLQKTSSVIDKTADNIPKSAKGCESFLTQIKGMINNDNN